MPQAQIPEKLINYSVYLNGSTFLGTADVTLPTLESMTNTVSGAGIAGEIDSPVLGHYASMTTTLNWRTITADKVRLHAPVSHALDFRLAQQTYDTAAGSYGSQGVKVSIKAMPKTGDLGTLNPGNTTDSSNELEVTYIKIDVDDATLLEIDKYNFKAVIDGVDYLDTVRSQLGL